MTEESESRYVPEKELPDVVPCTGNGGPAPVTSDGVAVRTWCCFTPMEAPHAKGCGFDPANHETFACTCREWSMPEHTVSQLVDGVWHRAVPRPCFHAAEPQRIGWPEPVSPDMQTATDNQPIPVRDLTAGKLGSALISSSVTPLSDAEPLPEAVLRSAGMLALSSEASHAENRAQAQTAVVERAFGFHRRMVLATLQATPDWYAMLDRLCADMVLSWMDDEEYLR